MIKAIEKLWLVAYLAANGIDPYKSESRESQDENGNPKTLTYFIFEITPQFKSVEDQYYEDDRFRQLRIKYIGLVKQVKNNKQNDEVLTKPL